MSITIAFTLVVATILLGGLAFDRWDRARRLRFGDEAGSTAAILPLARVESRKLAQHPTWLITAALITAVTVTLIVMDGGSETEAHSLPWFAFVGLPAAGLALVVSAHRTTTRSRRHGTDELVASTPTAPRARTAAHLLSTLAPLGVITLLLVIDLTLVYVLYEYSPRPTVDLILPMVVFVVPIVGGGVVGVFLGRWLPFAAAPLLGIVALIWLNNGVDHLHPRYRMLRVAVETGYGGPFDIVPYGWHLTFVASVMALGACLALWRHGSRAALGVATIAVVSIMVGTGWLITRPPSAAEVALVVDELEQPADHQSCEQRNGVTYCVLPGVEHWVDTWAPAVDSVLAQIPVKARPVDLRLVQRPEVDVHELLDEVEQAVHPNRVWVDDGDLHPNHFMNEEHPDLPVAWQAAAVAVGLPPATSWRWPVGCMAGGQARTVLAHVLAARATPTTMASFAEHADWVAEDGRLALPVPIDLEWDYDAEMPQPDSQRTSKEEWLAADGVTRRTHVPYAGASGWGADVAAALAIASTDDAAVDSVITTHWDELVDPATPSSRFLELVGVDARSDVTPPATPLDDPRACA